jgi:hypothetical protein
MTCYWGRTELGQGPTSRKEFDQLTLSMKSLHPVTRGGMGVMQSKSVGHAVAHIRSSHEVAMPLLMTHSWAGPTIELRKVIGHKPRGPTVCGAEDAFNLALRRCRLMVSRTSRSRWLEPGADGERVPRAVARGSAPSTQPFRPRGVTRSKPISTFEKGERLISFSNGGLTPEGPQRLSGAAPNLPGWFTDTVADQSSSWTEATTLRPGWSRTSSRARSVLRSGRCAKEAS